MGGVAAFATSIGAGFLGWAALRARVLPPWVAVTLIVIGLVTIPILFATHRPGLGNRLSGIPGERDRLCSGGRDVAGGAQTHG